MEPYSLVANSYVDLNYYLKEDSTVDFIQEVEIIYKA